MYYALFLIQWMNGMLEMQETDQINTVMISILRLLDNACVYGDHWVKFALCGFVCAALEIIYVNNLCNINK